MMTAITENTFIENLTRQFRRSPLQVNRLQESDAEIIQLDSRGTSCLAVTTDSIVEEIATGLYDDPYLIGWMTVMASMSDLAAVGANPLGILVSEVLPDNLPQDWLAELQRGIEKACEACDSFVLGGDTNSGEQLLLTGCALGVTTQARRLSRIGAKAGDHVYSTGSLGTGNAYALEHYLHHENGTNSAIPYQPFARLREGHSIAGIASSCMDTSDGALATLDQLMRLNHIGFELNRDIESLLHPGARLTAAAAGIAAWLLLAGQHGEFELIFTVSPVNELNLFDAANRANWQPIHLGRVIPMEEIRLPLYDQCVSLDTGRIRNLAVESGNDMRMYIQELCLIDNKYKKGALEYVGS
jgi:thiamine-monophosphate kinase